VSEAINQAVTGGNQQGNGVYLSYGDDGVWQGGLDLLIRHAVLQRLQDAGIAHFTVYTNFSWVSFDAAAIADLLQSTVGDVQVLVTPTYLGEQAESLMGERPAYNISIEYKENGQTRFFGRFPTGEISCGFPYVPAAWEQTGCLYIACVGMDGTPRLVQNSSYRDGWMIWQNNVCGIYGTAYKTPTPAFSDTAAHWAKDDIDFAVSRALIFGTSAEAFSPDAQVTRETFLAALGKLFGVAAGDYMVESGFADVSAEDPNASYLVWAMLNGIAQNGGDGRFEPDAPITREQAAVMLVNCIKAMQYALPTPRAKESFPDDSAIDAAARDAVTAAQQAGLLRGKGADWFNPQSTVTRGETCAILRRLTELIIDTDTALGHSLNDAGQPEYYEVQQGWLADK
jgi:hypothetical protein